MLQRDVGVLEDVEILIPVRHPLQNHPYWVGLPCIYNNGHSGRGHLGSNLAKAIPHMI